MTQFSRPAAAAAALLTGAAAVGNEAFLHTGSTVSAGLLAACATAGAGWAVLARRGRQEGQAAGYLAGLATTAVRLQPSDRDPVWLLQFAAMDALTNRLTSAQVADLDAVFAAAWTNGLADIVAHAAAVAEANGRTRYVNSRGELSALHDVSQAAYCAALGVLVRDDITYGDFSALTESWSAAGLHLPGGPVHDHLTLVFEEYRDGRWMQGAVDVVRTPTGESPQQAAEKIAYRLRHAKPKEGRQLPHLWRVLVWNGADPDRSADPDGEVLSNEEIPTRRHL